MRTLGIAVAAAVVLLVGLPPVFGYIAAGQIEDGVAELAVVGLDAEILDYDRGWFRSRAKLAVDASSAITAVLAEQGTAAGLFGDRPIVTVDLAHGPIAVLDGVSVGTSRFVARLDPETPAVAAAQDRLGVPYLFEFRGRVNFFGTLTYDASIPAFDTPLGANERFAFAGLDVDGTYSRGRLVAAAESESLALVSAGGTVSIDALALDVDRDLYERTGGGSISIGRGMAVDAFGTRTLLATSGLRLAGAAAAGTRETLRNLSLGLSADSLEVADWDVTAAELELDLRNIDSAVIEQYTTLARLGNAPDAEPFLRELLAAGPELELDPLRLRVDGEELSSTVHVSAKPGATPPVAALDPLAALAWLDAVEARAMLEVAKPLATRIAGLLVTLRQPIFDDSVPEPQRRAFAEAQAGLMLATLMAQGLIVDGGSRYRIEIGVVDGSLTVNGQRLL